ncbi:MAG: nucleotide exchange factor GrpE [Saprospiraceae bacterium]|nr:nucleotide exchange factor GrpE [Saprospiraceae bacterium]
MAKKKVEKKEETKQDEATENGASETQVKEAAEAATEGKSTEDELAELKDKYVRLFAEFDNYKKRTNRERLDLIRNAGEDLISKLLPVLDDFDRAKKTADDPSNEETFSDGVKLVYNKLYQILEGRGLEAMDPDEMDFDPELHEAITKIPAPSEDLKGKIIDHIEKGYYLNDKIIRHARVVIGE